MEDQEEKGLTDPLTGLEGKPFWIFSGEHDRTVPTAATMSQWAVLEAFGANTEFYWDLEAGHNADGNYHPG